MRLRSAAGPVAHRAAITIILPRGHSPQRAGGARRGVTKRITSDHSRLATSSAAALCALAVLSATLLGGAPYGTSSSAPAVFPGRSSASALLHAVVGTHTVAPWASPTIMPPLTTPPVVLPIGRFIHLPYRQP